MANACHGDYCRCECDVCESNRGTIFLLRHCGHHDTGCHDRC